MDIYYAVLPHDYYYSDGFCSDKITRINSWRSAAIIEEDYPPLFAVYKHHKIVYIYLDNARIYADKEEALDSCFSDEEVYPCTVVCITKNYKLNLMIKGII
jgi:hypothetical protein